MEPISISVNLYMFMWFSVFLVLSTICYCLYFQFSSQIDTVIHNSNTSPIFMTVCDELLLGIPHKAWLVALLVFLCLGLAFAVPSFLPSYLLQTDGSPQLANQIASKDSWPLFVIATDEFLSGAKN